MSRRSTGLSRDERNSGQLTAFSVDVSRLKIFSVQIFAIRNGISLRQAWKELASGRLEGVKVGSRTLIKRAAEKRWQRALPSRNATPKEPVDSATLATARLNAAPDASTKH